MERFLTQQKTLQQPQTHTYQRKGCRAFINRKFQSVFCNYTLSQIQLKAFYHLRQESNLSFQDNKELEQELLKELYCKYFGQTQGKLTGMQYLKLGFQSSDPKIDYRRGGGGMLSLVLIHNFIIKHPNTVKQMQNDSNFSFALTSIHIASLMQKYFHVCRSLKPEDNDVYCNREILKSFCYVIEQQSNAYYTIHQCLLKSFYYKIWKQSSPEKRVQHMKLIDELKQTIKRVFRKDNLDRMKQTNYR